MKKRLEVNQIDEISVVGGRLNQIGLDDHVKDARDRAMDRK
jgi:hypothetical protein